MTKSNKYYLKCKTTGHIFNSFKEWFDAGQECPDGCKQVDVWYYDDFSKLKKLINDKSFQPTSLWGYFDFLPLHHKENIVSFNEGIVPIDRWEFLEQFAKEKYGLNVKVYAHRNDRNPATWTFKDHAGTVAASVLKENKIDHFVAASTGNIGVAYACYLAAANIPATIFIPDVSLKSQEAEMSGYGQNVYRVNGDYHKAKMVAADFAKAHNKLLTAGNFCPMRLEAKKIMTYEWLRLLPEFPTVFMQAISGGSGPLGIAKSCEELKDQGMFEAMPRFILPQPGKCAPMAEAWDKAKASNFPQGWQQDYPVYENPVTEVNTLSTGNPTAYPVLGELTRQSNGEITAVDESCIVDITRLVAFEKQFKPGPAAAITIGGFIKSLRLGHFRQGDVVMLNIGESTGRSPLFSQDLAYGAKTIADASEAKLLDRSRFRTMLWEAIEKI